MIVTQLWFGKAFLRTDGGHAFMPSLILMALLFLGYPQSALAEPFMRVCKNGVIYYYFANRPAASPSITQPQRHIYTLHPVKRTHPVPHELEPLILEASRQHNLPPSLVKAVIRAESNFNPDATSPKGAQGLMQLMPGTADDLQVVNPYDIRENIWAGTRYLSMLLAKFGYRLPLALAAYNAGLKRVEQHQDVPPIQETQAFVRTVCDNFLKYAQEKSQTVSHGDPPVPGSKDPSSCLLIE